MPIIAHACAPVNVPALSWDAFTPIAGRSGWDAIARNLPDAELEPGSVTRASAATEYAGFPYLDAIKAERFRRSLEAPDAYEPSALDLALLHGDDHDDQPGCDDDVFTFSQREWDRLELEAEMMTEERELMEHNRAMCGYGDAIAYA